MSDFARTMSRRESVIAAGLFRWSSGIRWERYCSPHDETMPRCGGRTEDRGHRVRTVRTRSIPLKCVFQHLPAPQTGLLACADSGQAENTAAGDDGSLSIGRNEP